MKTGVRSALGLVVSLVGLAASAPVFAQSDAARLVEFFAGQGCAIGAPTIEAAKSTGFSQTAIDDLMAAAKADKDTAHAAGWMVLPQSKCTMRAPDLVPSEIKLSDPEVVKNISAPDQYAADGYPGCFLGGSELFDDVIASRGWDRNKAHREYMRFLAYSIRNGDLSFYSDDPVRTPPGFAVTSGECAKQAPDLAAINRSRELAIKHFDAWARADVIDEQCSDQDAWLRWMLGDATAQIYGEKDTNVFAFMDVVLLVRGAGWFEGESASSKGRGRPPLCMPR